jgi:hypothetical protein
MASSMIDYFIFSHMPQRGRTCHELRWSTLPSIRTSITEAQELRGQQRNAEMRKEQFAMNHKR